jgi:putative ABC transport system permease protein
MFVPVFILFITLLFAIYLVHKNINLRFLKAEQTHTIRSIQIPVFNIFQLACSVSLIICSLVIIRQINYITNKPIGLNKEVIEVKIPYQYRGKTNVYKAELLKSSSINNVSVVNASPVLEHYLLALKFQQNGVEKQYSPSGFSGDENYLDVLGIELVSGTGFSESSSANKNKCLVNESFARFFHGQDLIGKGMPGMENMIITGIVRDFNFSDLKSNVEPAFISYDNNGGHLLVKVSEKRSREARDAISITWKKLIPDYPVDIESVGDRFEWFHRNNLNLRRLIGSCAFISLFLSIIGLFALSYQKTLSRTKEIGIRKINGSTTSGILSLITGDFIKWTIIASIIAVPVSWYTMGKWLESYAYKIDLNWWIFVFSGIMVLGIVMLTVTYQSLKTAMRNPVEALRYE